MEARHTIMRKYFINALPLTLFFVLLTAVNVLTAAPALEDTHRNLYSTRGYPA